VYTQIKQV